MITHFQNASERLRHIFHIFYVLELSERKDTPTCSPKRFVLSVETMRNKELNAAVGNHIISLSYPIEVYNKMLLTISLRVVQKFISL